MGPLLLYHPRLFSGQHSPPRRAQRTSFSAARPCGPLPGNGILRTRYSQSSAAEEEYQKGAVEDHQPVGGSGYVVYLRLRPSMSLRTFLLLGAPRR